jgi:hypothetical protein
MDITNKTSTLRHWFRPIAALTATLALAACSADVSDSGTDESVTMSESVSEQADGLAIAAEKDDQAPPKISIEKEIDGDVSGETNDSTQSALKIGGGLSFDCTTECGGGGGCCTCYGIWDCLRLGTSGQCKSGTFGCGGDGCMCDWKLMP